MNISADFERSFNLHKGGLIHENGLHQLDEPIDLRLLEIYKLTWFLFAYFEEPINYGVNVNLNLLAHFSI